MKTGVSGNRPWQETRKYGHLIQEYVSFQYQVLRSQAFRSSSKHSEQSHSGSVIGDRDTKGEPTSVEDTLAGGASQFIYSSDDSNLVSARHRVKGCEAEGISSVQEIAVVVVPPWNNAGGAGRLGTCPQQLFISVKLLPVRCRFGFGAPRPEELHQMEVQ